MTNFANSVRRLILLLAILSGGGATLAQIQTIKPEVPPCSNISLDGGYGFIVNGTNPTSGPYTLVGRFVADGKGGITGSGAQSVKGVISRPSFTGTYTVNQDCTGTADLTFNFGGVAPLEFIIVDDGKAVDIIVAVATGTLGENEVGTATRQFNEAHFRGPRVKRNRDTGRGRTNSFLPPHR